MDADNIKTLQDNSRVGKERQVVFFFTTLGFDELKNKATVDFPSSEYAKTGSIPGLYVYDEFITEGKLRENSIKIWL